MLKAIVSKSFPKGAAVSHLDRVGVFASLACAIHCILLPFLITTLPLLGLTILGSHTFEAGILLFSVMLGVFSLSLGSRTHGKREPLFFLGLAILLFFGAHRVVTGDSVHGVLMALGGVSLAIGHILNIRLCKSCRD